MAEQKEERPTSPHLEVAVTPTAGRPTTQHFFVAGTTGMPHCSTEGGVLTIRDRDSHGYAKDLVAIYPAGSWAWIRAVTPPPAEPETHEVRSGDSELVVTTFVA